MGPLCEDPIADDVFSATSPNAEIDASDDPPATYSGYFYQSARPEVPTSAPQQFYHEYTLPTPPKSRRPSVEEVPDEDDVSHLSCPSLVSLASSIDSDIVREHFRKAAAADADTQDAYASASGELGDPDANPDTSDTRAPFGRVYDAFSAPGKLREAPSLAKAAEAVKDLAAALRGESRGPSSKGYKDPQIDLFVRHRLEGMRIFLNLYIDPRSTTYGHWGASALQASVGLGRGRHCMRSLCKLARQYIHDRSLLLVNPYGDWNESLLADEDVATDINLYLQEIGNDITAEKVVKYLARPEVMEKHGITKTISVRTARRYLNALGYRYSQPRKGQYNDGHERADVVYSRDKVYIPAIKKLEERMHHWRDDRPEYGPHPKGKRVIAWYHDESIFYAHDRKRKNWYHKSFSKLHQKGDGHSLMVSDFVSMDFGWSPSSLDGTRTARRFIKPGKNRDGYFTNEDVLEQANELMDILNEVYPDFEHVLIYDNATTHRKRPDGSLSARHMPKFSSKPATEAKPATGKKAATKAKPAVNFGVVVTARDADGKPLYTTSGQLQKVKIPMTGAEFDGKPQPLYFPANHPLEGLFKGMAVILQERGLGQHANKLAECKGFKCAPLAVDCCCRRVLFNQPDFANVKSCLETACEARGFTVLFLPKFHCELNFIEQVWGYAKRIYRFFPESSLEEDLERNVRKALDAVPLDMMRR